VKSSTKFAISLAVLAVTLAGALNTALSEVVDTPTNPFAKDPAALSSGKMVFESTCIACHGPGGIGGRGPAINSGSFTHGSSDYEVFQTIRGGIAGTQMPSFEGISSDDIWKIVSYLKSLASHGTETEVASGNAVRGRTTFFGKGNCASCHEIDSRGLDIASDLSAIGSKPIGALRDGVLHRNLPRSVRWAPPHFAEVETSDGQRLSGFVRSEDSFALHLQSRTGQITMLDKKRLRSLTPTGPAAPNIGRQLSSNEVEDVVAYLATHKGRDLSEAVKAKPTPVLPYAKLLNPDVKNWSTYWGNYNGHHFSDLNQVTPDNVKQLQAQWAAPLLGESVLEATPLVIDGVMYVAGPPGDVYAIDARSGMQIWAFHRKRDVKNPYEINPFNKGVAVLDGRVFFGTLDNNLIALDAHTGRELWETRIAETMEGYTLTGAPLAVKDKIIVGMSGGEMGVRGFLDAYDPETGKRIWRFYTIPKPDEPGGNTWPGESWKYGGAATWLTGSYDAELNTLYWAVGNPGPDYNPDIRRGDNLYSDCVLALDPDTGRLKWHYQFTPNDGHDWDSQEDMVLADQMIDGKIRKLLLHADRNGMFYVLDRTDGQFLWAKPFVKVTWHKGFDAKGRPIINPGSSVTPQGQIVYPAGSATNFQAPSYDKATGDLYLYFNDAQGFVASAPAIYERGKQFLGRGAVMPPEAPPPSQGIAAMDSRTGKLRWSFPLTRGNNSAGVLATRGGMLFVATAEGQLVGLDMKSGQPKWHFRTGVAITASPISYAVDGRQFISVAAGNMIYAFGLPD